MIYLIKSITLIIYIDKNGMSKSTDFKSKIAIYLTNKKELKLIEHYHLFFYE